MAMELIETIEVGSGGASSIEFTSIPQDGVDLLLVFSLRNSATGTISSPTVKINNSLTGFTQKQLRGSGTSVVSASLTNGYVTNTVPASSATANTFGNGQIYVSNYTSGSAKSLSYDSVSEDNATNAYQLISAVSNTTTSAITSMALGTGDSFVQYSTASLYKIS